MTECTCMCTHVHTHIHTHTHTEYCPHLSHSTIYRESTHYVSALSDKESSYMCVAIPTPGYQKNKMRQDWEDAYRIDLRLHMCDKCWRTYKGLPQLTQSEGADLPNKAAVSFAISVYFPSVLYRCCTQYCKKPQNQHKFTWSPAAWQCSHNLNCDLSRG